MKNIRLRIASILTLLCSGIVLSSSAQALKFSNQFVEFELPNAWQCSLEGAEWVCQSTEEAKKKDAIIVLAAKLKGDQDSLDQYQTYLNSAKTYTSVQGKPVKSEVKAKAEQKNYNGHPWVDALHLESEIPGFYTRYLATVKQDIGVLVTYSINKNKYTQYIEDFETLVKSLKVFRKQGGINAAPANTNLFANTQVPNSIAQETVFSAEGAPQGGADATAQPKAEDDSSLLILLAAGVGLIGFILWRRKKSG